jgi:two-component system, chemotaxis family, protein-glutamate methylesterase/glutaminase
VGAALKVTRSGARKRTLYGVEQQPTHVVGIGASAGGVDALLALIRRLPADLDAALCIVLHVPATGRSVLAPILARRTDLTVEVAADGAALKAGRVYVAPPDRHLTVAAGRVRLTQGPKENGVRPAADPLLRSLAAAYGERAVAVVLSGALRDGSSGALAVSRAGGAVIVQDPEEATVPSMPESALAAVGEAARVLPAAQIGPALENLAAGVPMREDAAMNAPREPPEPIRTAPGRHVERPHALDLPTEAAE